jgi:aerobic carbon-monoxide dehydrogenase large subunit
MGEFAIGQSVLQREDPRLLRGQGRFFDDLKLADQLHAAIVRSPHAHADITGIDRRAALQMSGVHAVLTGADYRGDGLGSLPSMAAYQRRGGGPMFRPPTPAPAVVWRRNGPCRARQPPTARCAAPILVVHRSPTERHSQ